MLAPKNSALILFNLAILCGARCAYASSNTLVYGVENEIKNYNIARSLDRHTFLLAELTTQGLFWQEPSGALHPQLAKSVTYSHAKWVIELNEARFSGGRALTCEDARANFTEAWQSKRPISGRLRDIQKISCQKNTLTIQTRKESGQLMKRIGAIIRIYDPATLASTNPDGSGPYKVLRREGKDLVLARNAYYIGEATRFDEIRFRTLGDAWLRDLALFSGNVDMLMENFSLLRLKAFASHAEKSNLYRLKVPELVYFGINARHFPLEIRQRVASAIRSSTAVQRFWGDEVQLVQNGPLDLFARPEDHEKMGGGREIRSRGPIHIEVSVAPDETMLGFLRELARDLKAQKIDLSIRPLEFASFMKRLNEQSFEAYVTSLDVSHVQNYEGLLHSRGNRLGVANPELDQLFEWAIETSDDKILAKIESQIGEKINAFEVLIPLYHPFATLVTQKGLKIHLTGEGFWRDLLLRSEYVVK